ncbi:hypothetical protein J3D55_000694 [Chryseobacterium ginsenosidimutans]|uniref:glycine zipper domain-containing protein n=1 Tax=Chryseobacterium ginsenosidimutans TaxID=687846 RepID=UPI00216744D7|nr:glycine zipper domain-containing protein [Chryseobacterium ginsenosidimutans]MCS3867778.1 hypothetical protein [Chryseobacterium ginsenosidimutans]
MENFRTIKGEDLDPKYLPIANKISDSVLSAAHKALLSINNPRQYALNNDSIEFNIKNYLSTIPQVELQKGVQKVIQGGSLPKVSDLVLLKNLQNKIVITDTLFSKVNVTTKPMSLKVDFLNKGNSNFMLNVTQLRCNEETGATSAGSDHVFVQAVKIDGFGNSIKAPVVDLEGGWDNGNVVNWKNRGEIKNFANFNLDYGKGWPRKCTVVLAMSIRSSEGLEKLMDQIAAKAKEEVIKYLSAAAGAIAGAKIGAAIGTGFGPIGTIVGAAVGAIVGAIVAYVFDKLYGWFKDLFFGTKLFKPVTIEYSIPYSGYKTNNEGYTVTWTGHYGKYTADIEAVLEWGKGRGVSTAIKHGKFIQSTVYKVNNENKIGFYWNYSKLSNSGKWGDTKGMASVDAPITAVGNFESGQVEILVIGLDGRVWNSKALVQLMTNTNGMKYGEFNGWIPVLDGVFVQGTKVAGASRSANMIDIFCLGTDGQVWTAAKGPQTKNVWAGWWPIGGLQGIPGTALSVVSRSAGILDVFVVGLDGRVYSTSYDPSSSGKWINWFYFIDYDKLIPGIEVTAVSRKQNLIELFAVNVDGDSITASWSPATGWKGWENIQAGKFTPGTTISVANHSPENIDIFGISTDGRVWTAAKGPQTNNKWAGWWPIGDMVFEEGSTLSAISTSPNMLNVFVTGKDGNTYAATYDGSKWQWDNIG